MLSLTTFDDAFWLFEAPRSQVQVYTNIACCAWVVWDWISTLDDEIELVWLSRWSLSKCLYLVTRYFGLFLLSAEATSEMGRWNHAFCHYYFGIAGLGTALILFLVEIGMQFRVHALYNGSRRLTWINVAVFIAEVGAMCTFLTLDYRHRVDILDPPYPLTGCWNTVKPQLLALTWWIALAYELYLFVLVAYKAFSRYREEGHLMGCLRLMFVDACIWFFFIAGILAWNAFAFLDASNGYVFLGLPFMHAASSIGGARLIIGIRKSWRQKAEPELAFVPRPPTSFASSGHSKPGENASALEAEWYERSNSGCEDIALCALAATYPSLRIDGRVPPRLNGGYFELPSPIHARPRPDMAV